MSEEGEVLRGPTRMRMAEEAPQLAEEVEARKLKAEDLNAEPHEAVRQLKDKQTPIRGGLTS